MFEYIVPILIAIVIFGALLWFIMDEVKKKRAMKSSPEKTAYVEVIRKNKEEHRYSSGDRINYKMTFLTQSKEEKTFEVPKQSFYTSEVGDFGILSTKDIYFYKFVNEEKRTG